MVPMRVQPELRSNARWQLLLRLRLLRLLMLRRYRQRARQVLNLLPNPRPCLR
jgi:hypothetical protein